MSEINFTKIPFVAAKWFTKVDEKKPRNPNLIVIHSMEAPEKPETAENVAKYFHSGSESRQASAHYCIDGDSIVQCVQCADVAYGAPSANRRGIHLEHAGYADQSLAQWKDEYSLQMLKNSANLCGKVLIPKFGIRPEWLSLAEIRAGESGFATHADITRAWREINPETGKPFDPKYSGDHMDPGPYFPKNEYMDMIRLVQMGKTL